ncbi:hypothetical protein WJX84_008060 [Apatococcus fuscideae]|uniref:Uncharacterized protein n=1 Tax=Apatococcus fuscideae TaxID=2026836 RepID=A0AAW1SZN9_9CHLO
MPILSRQHSTGDGKLLVAAADKFEAVVGIEKYRDRVATSKQNLQSLPEEHRRRVTLIEADCNDEDLSESLVAFTHGWQLLLFCNNVAFPAGLNKRLAGNVLRLMQVWPQNVCMVSALPLDTLASFFVQEVPFHTSWGTLHVGNVYTSSTVPQVSIAS